MLTNTLNQKARDTYMRLRHKDWSKLFNGVAKLYSDVEPTSLSSRVISSVNTLISGEITAVDFFTEDGNHSGEYWFDPPGSISESEYAVFMLLAPEHPFVPSVFRDGNRGAIKTTDFLTPTQFRETALYNEYYGPLSVHNQLLISLSVDDLVVTCALNRTDSDFTEEERTMLDLIGPHLTNAIRTGRKIQALLTAEANLNSVLEAKSSGVISIDGDGRILYISEFARTLVEKYFGHKKLQSEFLPDSLDAWLTNGRLSPPPEMKVAGRNACLTITPMWDGSRNERTLILEESKERSPLDLTALGLTRRQTEILFLISQGKTDRDVGVLLGISPRTVHKHTENIYRNLGVETRTAAMLRAFEILH